MSKLIKCDNCEKTINEAFATKAERENYLNNWYHNSEYDFDACCDICYSELYEAYSEQ